MTITHSHASDLQAEQPVHPLSLDAVGVTGVVRGIVLGGRMPTTARFDVATALGDDQRGAHMSRFHEAIDAALDAVGSDGWDVPGLDLLAFVLAARAASLQGAARADVRIDATVTVPRVTPERARRTIDPCDVWAAAEVAAGETPRVTVGVRVSGITACPCAQLLVREQAHATLQADSSLSGDQVDEVLGMLAMPTHNQRGITTLELVVRDDVSSCIAPIDELADLARSAMSAATHELLKREDERAVVQRAHDAPRFVEDCVRELLMSTAQSPLTAALGDDTVVRVQQDNHESIHAHDVRATREATLGQLRAAVEAAS